MADINNEFINPIDSLYFSLSMRFFIYTETNLDQFTCDNKENRPPLLGGSIPLSCEEASPGNHHPKTHNTIDQMDASCKTEPTPIAITAERNL